MNTILELLITADNFDKDKIHHSADEEKEAEESYTANRKSNASFQSMIETEISCCIPVQFRDDLAHSLSCSCG